MNYQKIYNQLIEKRQINKIIIKDYKLMHPDEPTPERHHIIPKSLGGSNTNDNLITLTCREHFVAHQLLVKIAQQLNDKNMLIKMTHAIQCFYNLQQKKCKDIVKNSRQYNYYKKLNKEVGVNESTRQLMRDNWKIRKLTPESDETRKKRSLSHIGYKHTEKAKQNMSIAQLNRYKRPGEIEKKRQKAKEVFNRPEIKKQLKELTTQYWKNLSDDERKQRSNSLKGKRNGMYGKHPIYVYNEKTDDLKMLFDKEEVKTYLQNGYRRGYRHKKGKSKLVN